MTYRIIGVDGRQYGPVTTEELRGWISAGRANGATLAQPEGSTDWKPLGNCPEFATLTPSPALPPLTSAADPRKSKIAAGLLGIFLGGFGVHRFYLGYTGIGVAQILVTFATCGIGSLWGFIEGILILVGTSITTDAQGQSLKD
jgi:TM2 domain-containing membrane protein YozV